MINEFHLTLVPLPMTQMIPDEKDLLGIRADPNTCEEAIPLIAHGSVKIEPMIPYIFPPRRVWKATEVLRVKAGIGSKGYR